jgi:hypothetical protein
VEYHRGLQEDPREVGSGGKVCFIRRDLYSVQRKYSNIFKYLSKRTSRKTPVMYRFVAIKFVIPLAHPWIHESPYIS